MLSEHEKFYMQDKGKKNHFFIEVNYEGNAQCKTLKFTFPNGDVAFIDKKHLVELVFAIGKPSEQREIVPQTITRTKWYETVLSVKATKDIRKGENITFPIKISIPDQTEEIVGSLKDRLKTKSFKK